MIRVIYRYTEKLRKGGSRKNYTAKIYNSGEMGTESAATNAHLPGFNISLALNVRFKEETM